MSSAALSGATHMLESRAMEAVIWGMPAVNFERLTQAMSVVGGSYNQIVYWSRLPDWKNQTLTPNPDTVYLFSFINTADVGPVVLEIPAADDGSITGSIDDAWQNALEDVGPAGADRGQGGRYLILPPGYSDDVPEGYIVLRSTTYANAAFLRSILSGGSEAHVAKAVAYGKRIRVYPLSEASHPHATTFVDTIDEVYDSTIPYDVHFFEALHSFVQREPWLERDRVMIDQLKSLGIEKGKPFTPDSEMKEHLLVAANAAHEWIEERYYGVFSPSYYEGTHWALPASPDLVNGMSGSFAEANSYPVDGRAVLYSFVFFSARHLGAGQFYLMTINDQDGSPFDGASTYRLHVPANVPVKQYWSATIYDRETHTLIRDMPRSSRSSQNPELHHSDDGSVDLFFGPRSPSGESGNWVPTMPGRQFEVLFRFYAPDPSFFDKVWTLPDIERMNADPRRPSTR